MPFFCHALLRPWGGRGAAFISTITVTCARWALLAAMAMAMLLLAAPAHAAGNAVAKRAATPGTNATVPGDEGDGGSTTPRIPTFFEQGVPIRSGEVIQPLGPNLMGDTLNEFSGGLAFSHSDVELPGNNALRVAVGRQLATGTRQAALGSGLFGDWDLEIPRLHTVAFNAQPNWYGGNGLGSYNLNRCSQLTEPPRSSYTAGNKTVGLHPASWWSGYKLYVPGAGDQTLFRRAPFGAGPVNPIQPTDGGVYPVLTKQHWQLSCLPVMERGAGEGFVARAPDGTRYQFDHMVQRAYPALDTYRYGTVPRIEIWILPTLVTDRFGNWVRYNYAGADGFRVASIVSSDGRAITFTYNGWGNRIQTASDGTRTWTYGYDGTGALQTVTLPDNSQWRFALAALERDPFSIEDPGCGQPPNARWDPNVRVGTIVHPSGAVGSFSLKMTMHGRTNVPGSEAACEGPSVPAIQANLVSRHFASYSLIGKTLSGPGMPAMTWVYGYSAAFGDWAPSTGTKTVTITDPKNHITRKTYGTAYGVNDGLLLGSSVSEGATLLQTTSYAYRAPTAGPYPALVGYEGGVSDSMGAIYTPMYLRTTTQQAINFTRTTHAFDAYARPTSFTRASSMGFSRNEATEYYDQRSLWVLGQVRSHSVAGQQVDSTSFDDNTALPAVSYKFGRAVASYAFHADGSLYAVTDGLNHTTTFTNWKRGLPQNIGYADGTGSSGVVHDIGVLTSITNEAGTTWRYGYDAMGRLARKTPPAGDPVAYHDTLLSFEQVPYEELGLEPNHWRQTIVTGSAVTLNYFDARWRKRLTTTYDANNRAGTERVQRFEYDPYNRTTFASYPLRSFAEPALGTRTFHDALGRTTRVESDSELGVLATNTVYRDNFLREVTNPRGAVSTYAFQAFDQPSEDVVRSAWLPEGVWLNITRNDFGNTTAVQRGTGNVSVSRRYVYDAFQRLCMTIEPESGATVQLLDAADNVAWRASGLSVGNPGVCDFNAVPAERKISHSYDARNRLKDTAYGDGSRGIQRTYTPDGLLEQIVTVDMYLPITWTYSYNNRRLLTRERYTWAPGDAGDPNRGMPLHRSIDAYGHLSAITDVWSTINYSPNALGEASEVSGYASGVRYHPNGAVAAYTLANGISHNLSLNARGLPEEIQDGGVVWDRYTYDANGNVTGIADLIGQGLDNNSRTMPWYDGLDRLRQASGPWGGASFGYDAQDNLISSTVGGRSLSHNINPATNRLDSLTGSENTSIAYDANGNIRQRGAQGFVFDIGNRMISAANRADYFYDGQGRRNLMFFVGGDYMHQMYTQDGKLRFSWRMSQGGRRHVYLGDKLIAETVDSGVTTYAHTDALGSPVARTNASGQVLSRTRYEPYGATVAGSVNPTGIGFTGHVNDPDTGLVYMQQRYYDPIAGRFLSVDPVTTDANTGKSFNRYAYAENDPYGRVDPDGQDAKSAFVGIVEEFKGRGRRKEPDPPPKPERKPGERAEEPRDCRNPNGCNGKQDHQDKVKELAGKAQGEAKEGETVLENKKIQGRDDSNRKPDVQIVNKEGKTRKIFEAERKPSSQRNRDREAEYDRLGIPHETHGLK
jgi:RHS repeat-associated protein